MTQDRNDRRTVLNTEPTQAKESTLLPMLFGCLALIVIGAGVVMTVV